MENINVFIKENIKNIGSGVHVTPDIPEKKLNNAIKAMHCEDFYQSIIAIQDGTIFGSSKEGFVFTGEKFIHHEHGEFPYSEIKSVEYKKDVKVDDKGKEKIDEYILINKNDKVYKFDFLYDIEKENFAKFLNDIINKFDDFEEENQLRALEDMSEELKIAYLKIAVNMTFVDDEEIDEKELSELYLLMTRLKLDKETRFKIRAYITEISKENIENINDLLNIIKKHSEISHHKSIMISLAKDLINIYFSTKDTMDRSFNFLEENRKILDLSDAEISLAYDTVENDHKILKEELDDNAIQKNAKELATKAAAAGVPLAAVYISGSVIGMSAAGITSGLATLGMGMGMTGGLVVVGLIGVFSYKGLRQLTGANELDKYKTREMMLHEVIKQTQKTITLIIEDINYVVQKLNNVELQHIDLKKLNEILTSKSKEAYAYLSNAIKQNEKLNKEIKKLKSDLVLFQGAMKSIDQKGNECKNSAQRLHCPTILDKDRLESLTEEATKRPLYEFVINNYELVVSENKEEMFMLKKNTDTDTLDDMASIFEKIGYINMDNIIKSKASSLVKSFLK